MFSITPTEAGDVAEAVAALGEAFSGDPLMPYFFEGSLEPVRERTSVFFAILMRVRLALGMPVLVLREGERVLGAAMGYDASGAEWPDAFSAEWVALESSVPGAADRFAAYDRLSEAYRPAEPHYYLGVLGVHPSMQGKGAGRALLEAFCERSRHDERSAGVYLETASPASLQFYYRNGFKLRGQGLLGDLPLWCVYRRT